MNDLRTDTPGSSASQETRFKEGGREVTGVRCRVDGRGARIGVAQELLDHGKRYAAQCEVHPIEVAQRVSHRSVRRSDSRPIGSASEHAVDELLVELRTIVSNEQRRA